MAAVAGKRPIGRPKGEQTQNAARRRKQLIEAAIDSIVALGLSGTTLASVAKAAGLSQGVAVFYFKSKENLLIETLKYHFEEYDVVWQRALANAGDDPVDRLTAVIMADLDPDLCSQRNLALWNSFWGETAARPRFGEVCDSHDKARYAVLAGLCRQSTSEIIGDLWTPDAVADALESITDGMWIRLHITPDFTDRERGKHVLATFLASVFPSAKDRIFQYAEALG